MALGGLLALYYVKFDKHRISAFFKNRYSLYLALVLSFCVTLFSIPFASPFVPFVYGFLLLALAMQPGAIPLLNNSVLRYLGQISYGIYMFNILVSVLALNIILHLSSGQLDVFVEHFWLANIAYYTLALGGTLWLSHLSYQHYERPFLKLKEKFAKV
jgi:peptidoglycan/LPS O-acetylase OafA/YrhL